jgi:hypothetical protein
MPVPWTSAHAATTRVKSLPQPEAWPLTLKSFSKVMKRSRSTRSVYEPVCMFGNTTCPAPLVLPSRSDTPLTITCAEGSGLPPRSVTSTLTVAVGWMAGAAMAAGATEHASRIRPNKDFMAQPPCAISCEAGATATRCASTSGACDELLRHVQRCQLLLSVRRAADAVGRPESDQFGARRSQI